jgi:DNA-binding NarL/FixJ family response regulator
MTPIKIAIVDDHALFRRGISNLLQEFPDIRVAFEACNGGELQQLLPSHPDVSVLLMDINMPAVDGYQATAWVKEHYSQVHVLALSMFDEDLAIIRMLKAGAGGYVLKECQPSELYQAICEINKKGVFLNEMVSGKMLKTFQALAADTEGPNLTPRETEFIQWCVSELTYKEIADKMKVAPRSVDNYRENLFEKLALKSRVGLVLYALRNNIAKL